MNTRPEELKAAGLYEPWPHRGTCEPESPGKLLLSSTGRGWSGLSAELCTARRGVVPWRTPQSDIRICVALRSGGESTVTRRAPGIESRIAARRGAVWFSPPGLQDGLIDFAQDTPEFLQLYLPLSCFSWGNSNADTYQSVVDALSYERAFEDPLLAEIGFAVVSELKTETSTGNLLVGALAASLAARLVQRHTGASSAQSFPHQTNHGLDRRRLSRVLDYIEANLEGNLSIDRMASIACLSRYHFARAFRQAVGQPPHRYVSARRLDRAKELLTRGDRRLVDIALSLGFSGQANFTRAFTQATGHAPGRYRQTAGSRRSEFSLTDVRRSLPILA
jgi:AraC family transcriptional regulator